jgi:hypothetical protein
MKAIKMELANAVKLLNIESYTKRDPLRCMLNLVLIGESNLNQFQQQPFAIITQNQTASSNINDNIKFLPANATKLNLGNQTNQSLAMGGNNTIVLQTINKPIFNESLQGPLSSQVVEDLSDFLYYQALGNQCAAEFLYQTEMLLMNRRRYLCAKNDDMKNISIFDSNNNIIAFKWTYKEAERMTDIFNKYSQCKSIENIIYPQVINKAYGDLAVNKPCMVEADILYAMSANVTINQPAPISTIGQNATNVTIALATPVPVNTTVLVNATNPKRFLSQNFASLGKNPFIYSFFYKIKFNFN